MSDDEKKVVATGKTEQTNDFPLSSVPENKRRGFWSLAVVLLGFTFYTGTMAAATTLGAAFNFKSLMWIIFWGDLILGAYASLLAYIAAKTGLTTSLMARYSFGKYGALWVDFLLGGTQVGWYGYSTALTAYALSTALGWDSKAVAIVLMVIFGFAFCSTAFVGYRGMEILSYVAVPAMTILIFWSMSVAVKDAGGMAGVMSITPTTTMGVGAALTVVVGTYVSGGLQSTNWSRFAKNGKQAVLATMLAFFIGNGFMIVAGAFGAFVYQVADMVEVLTIQGLLFAGILLLMLNIWTSQDNTIYAFSIAASSAFHTEKRRRLVLIGAAIGTLIGILGIYDALVPFLVFLGSVIPPVGGVIAADFFLTNKGRYVPFEKAKFENFNWIGIVAYLAGIACSKLPFGITAINAGVGGALAYIILALILKRKPIEAKDE